jgi:hypothetical protein
LREHRLRLVERSGQPSECVPDLAGRGPAHHRVERRMPNTGELELDARSYLLHGLEVERARLRPQRVDESVDRLHHGRIQPCLADQ